MQEIATPVVHEGAHTETGAFGGVFRGTEERALPEARRSHANETEQKVASASDRIASAARQDGRLLSAMAKVASLEKRELSFGMGSPLYEQAGAFVKDLGSAQPNLLTELVDELGEPNLRWAVRIAARDLSASGAIGKE